MRRYCWLPVRDCKHDRRALQTRLFAALAFAGLHICGGSAVAIVCDDGEYAGLSHYLCLHVTPLEWSYLFPPFFERGEGKEGAYVRRGRGQRRLRSRNKV